MTTVRCHVEAHLLDRLLSRMAAACLPDHHMISLMVSAALWELAFLAFIVLHAKALLTDHR
ncbi:MAG: hypothetical protein HOJ90_05775 [Alphaproteobacteria bacterium]|nr:hypothetical protein [Alphaproteobacteria bacterium]